MIFNILFSLSEQISFSSISINTKWKQHGVTVAAGHGKGHQLNQLSRPINVYLDDDRSIYVADLDNHRIMEWKKDTISGQVVAGGNGQGNRNDQLNQPTKVIIDKQNDSLIICDYGNRRVVRWPRRNDQSGEILISTICC